MPSLSGHSRRALMAAAGALAAVPVAEAKNKKKKGKKKKKLAPPLAFGVGHVTILSPDISGSSYICDVETVYWYPAAEQDGQFAGGVGLPFAEGGDDARARIVSHIQLNVSAQLENSGYDVPMDRVAVTLL